MITGELLMSLRNMTQQSRREFAKAIGISSSLLSKIERGERRISERTMSKLMSAYPIDPFFINKLKELKEEIRNDNF